MASTTPTIGWVCIKPMRVEAVAAMLEDCHEGIPSAQLADGETYSGRIGPAKVIVARPQAGAAWATGQSFAATLLASNALVVTGCVADESFGANPGDVLICPTSGGIPVNHSSAPANILQRAIDVLNGEVGEEGYWLLSNLQQRASIAAMQCSARAADGRERDVPNSPRLHYLQDNETVERFLVWDGATLSEKAPCSQRLSDGQVT